LGTEGGESGGASPRLWARKEINAATARVHLISFLTRVVVVQYSIIVFKKTIVLLSIGAQRSVLIQIDFVRP